MKRRRDPSHRCVDCRLPAPLCLCGLLPRLPTRTRIVLVLHQLEARKTTNTGLLAVRCLPNSETVVRGRLGEERHFTGPQLAEDPFPWQRAPGAALLLFPHDDAQPIGRWRDHPEPLTLVVPDGTWGQAIRARKRLPGLDRLPCAVVPEAPSRYELRHDGRPGHVCTLEAIARALGALEGPEVQERLEWILQVMVDRSLWSAGRLPAHRVTGGLPDEARAMYGGRPTAADS